MERASSAAFNSVAQGLMGTLTGSMIDYFFPDNEHESVLSSLALLSVQNLAAGLAMSTVVQISGSQDDPTGGAFSLVPFFFSMPRYQSRLQRVAEKIRGELERMTDAGPRQ